ncbi:hypothetical protein Taro_039237 [Colocasia esculenta]|uniref:Secreted protein n=1 Tax=Colocasia esculenta TaxID=4460 RepID=A0A843WLK9_COLES|nr:hypothetical protein [Colocasia esculenta]
MWCVPLCLHGLWFGIPCEASARSREADSDQVRYWFNGLGRGVPSQLVSEQEISGMVDRRDWGGGGDDPEESTQEYDRNNLGKPHGYSGENGLAGASATSSSAIWGWRGCTCCNSSAKSGSAFCSTCATTTTSADRKRTSDAGGKVSKIAAAYLFRRAESRYNRALGS